MSTKRHGIVEGEVYTNVLLNVAAIGLLVFLVIHYFGLVKAPLEWMGHPHSGLIDEIAVAGVTMSVALLGLSNKTLRKVRSSIHIHEQGERRR